MQFFHYDYKYSISRSGVKNVETWFGNQMICECDSINSRVVFNWFWSLVSFQTKLDGSRSLSTGLLLMLLLLLLLDRFELLV